MNSIRILAAWAAALFLCAAGVASAQSAEDWIYTANADRPIVGHIHDETFRDLVLRFAGGGEMRIPMSDLPESARAFDSVPTREVSPALRFPRP